MKAPLSDIAKGILANNESAKALMEHTLLAKRGVEVAPIEYEGKKYVLKRIDRSKLG